MCDFPFGKGTGSWCSSSPSLHLRCRRLAKTLSTYCSFRSVLRRQLIASSWAAGFCQQEQTELIWGIKDELRKVCSTNDLKELLIANKQEVPSGENAVSWSVVALPVCWIFELVKPTQTNITARSTSLKHVTNALDRNPVQNLVLLAQNSDGVVVTLACEGPCRGVWCWIQHHRLVSVMCLYSGVLKLVPVLFWGFFFLSLALQEAG